MIALVNVGKVGTLSHFVANYCERIKQLDNHTTILFPYCNHVFKTYVFKFFPQLITSNPAQNRHN